jgi:signal transduction histidine kinase/CheY-like chemotaxis protein
MKPIAVWLTFFCGLLFTVSGIAGWLEKPDEPTPLEQPLMEWCQVSPSVSIETVSGEGCSWQPLEKGSTGHGFSRDAFWVRLALDNAGVAPLERWIKVGHPRLAEISLYTLGTGGWVRQEVGNRTPMAARGDVEREFAIFPVSVPPKGRQQLWIRVFSETAIDLTTTIWAPADYLHAFQRTQFWVILGQGGVLITLLFALLMFGLTRQSAYLYFVLGLGGSLANVALSTGVLQRTLWPEDWPLPSELIAVNALISTPGYYGFIRTFLPDTSRYRKANICFKWTVLITVVGLIYAITIDYRAAATAWGISLGISTLSGAILTFLAWRDGDRTAGILLIALSIHLGIALLRLMLSVGRVAWFPEVSVIGTWGLVLSAPVILLGLVDRTRELLTELNRVQADNVTQLSFLARMSHELRSPLDTILGNVQMLARTRQDPTVTERLSMIFESSRHLLRMIDHILDFSRGLAGVHKMVPSPVHFDPFLRGIERTARLLAAKQGNRFVLHRRPSGQNSEGLVLLLDADPLRRVLDNLIANAARHTHNGVITLTLELSEAGTDQLRLDFAVTDTGEGIAPADLQRIFMPFERVRHGKANDGKGAGLGLAIACQLTELMGGTLTVESEPEHGSCFRFWVLAKRLPPEADAPMDTLEGFEAAGYLGRRQSILVVDDNEANRALLVGLLEELGFQVTQAGSGQSAAEQFKSLAALDLVITDQFMDDGDGWMVLQAADVEWPGVPVLLASAAPPSPPLNYPAHLRFSGHFLRPLDHEQLLRRVGDLLELTWSGTPTRDHSVDAAEVKPQVNAISSRPIQRPDDNESIAYPSEKDLRALATLVETGQVTSIKEWAIALKAGQPEFAGFSERVLAATKTLDMEALRALADGMESTCEK